MAGVGEEGFDLDLDRSIVGDIGSWGHDEAETAAEYGAAEGGERVLRLVEPAFPEELHRVAFADRVQIAERAIAADDLDGAGPDAAVGSHDHLRVLDEADESAVGLWGGDEELTDAGSDKPHGDMEWRAMPDQRDAGGCALCLVEDQSGARFDERLLELQEPDRLVRRGGREEEIGAEVEALFRVGSQRLASAGVVGARLGDAHESAENTDPVIRVYPGQVKRFSAHSTPGNARFAPYAYRGPETG